MQFLNLMPNLPKRWLIGLYLTAAAWGVVMVLPEDARLGLLGSALFAITVTMWAITDASRHSVAIPKCRLDAISSPGRLLPLSTTDSGLEVPMRLGYWLGTGLAVALTAVLRRFPDLLDSTGVRSAVAVHDR